MDFCCCSVDSSRLGANVFQWCQRWGYLWGWMMSDDAIMLKKRGVSFCTMGLIRARLTGCGSRQPVDWQLRFVKSHLGCPVLSLPPGIPRLSSEVSKFTLQFWGTHVPYLSSVVHICTNEKKLSLLYDCVCFSLCAENVEGGVCVFWQSNPFFFLNEVYIPYFQLCFFRCECTSTGGLECAHQCVWI